MSDKPLPPKKDVALELLKGPSVFVHLDPRFDGVIVPKWFKRQPQLVLQIGFNMAVPIPDLVVDDNGVRCTLSFNRAPFYCTMPWTAIYALVGDDGRGMIWPEDIPPELAARTAQKPALKVVDSKKPRKRPKPALVGAKPEPPRTREPVESSARDSNRDSDRGKSKLPPYLRVIK